MFIGGYIDDATMDNIARNVAAEIPLEDWTVEWLEGM
jgi:hypothetical protein